MMRRQIVQHAIQPGVMAPAVLEQDDLPALLVRQRAESAQQGGRVRRRAEAHCLYDRVVAVRWFGEWEWGFGGFG